MRFYPPGVFSLDPTEQFPMHGITVQTITVTYDNTLTFQGQTSTGEFTDLAGQRDVTRTDFLQMTAVQRIALIPAADVRRSITAFLRTGSHQGTNEEQQQPGHATEVISLAAYRERTSR